MREDFVVAPSERLITAKRVSVFLALLLGYLFLYVFWQQSKNGRFALSSDGQSVLVLDTRTGEVIGVKIRGAARTARLPG
jgi:hypothetical protein